MINFFFENIDSIKLPQNVDIWLTNLLLNENKKLGEINYIFGDDEFLLKINREYLQHDYYTDVITFDYVKGSTISGDIFISLQRIQDNAKSQNIPFEEELRRVLAHGLLHLCGYKDKTIEEQILMRAKEDFYLKQFS